jgi:[acyl-carrier-protein] S-malonyltransferase
MASRRRDIAGNSQADADDPVTLRRPLAFLYPPQPLDPCPSPDDFLKRMPALAALFDETLHGLGWDRTMRRAARTCPLRPRSLERLRAAHVGTVAFGWAVTQRLEQAGIVPDVVFGHSLGLHSALAASRAASIVDTLEVADRTAKFIARWGEELDGAMLAIVGFTPLEVAEVCERINRQADTSDPCVAVAIVNSTRQVIVSGERWAIERIARRMRAKQAWGVRRLPGHLPLHMPLMARLAEPCEALIGDTHCHVPHIPLVHPTTGMKVRTVSGVELLWRTHLIGLIDYTAALARLERMGVASYVEVGTGQTLAQLGRWFRRDLPIVSMQTPDDLERICHARVE